MKIKYLGAIAAVICLNSAGMAQAQLTLKEAFEQALSNNHQIKVLENRQEVAENSVSAGNAGLLPSVNVGGSYGANIQNTDLEFAGNIPPTSVDGAQSSTLAANATVNYVLFSGLSGQRNFQKLKLNKIAVDAQSRASIEATLLQVANAYYALDRANDQLNINQENLEVSEARYRRAKLANELGTALRTQMLNARVDLTADSTSYLTAELNRNIAARNLSRLIGGTIDPNLETEDFDIEIRDWTEQQLIDLAMTNNATLKNLELQRELASKDLQLSKSSYFPTVSLSGGYSYTNQQSEAGIVLSNTAAGWNGQIGVSYTLFNGFKNDIQRQNQAVMLETSLHQLEDQKLQLQADISNALDAYRQSIRVLMFEENNLESSELNLERSDALFKAGQITSTQFREAQLALTNARNRISNARITVQLNELEIMRLTGQILSLE